MVKEHFFYLGSTISYDGEIDADVEIKLQKQQMLLVVLRSQSSLTVAYLLLLRKCAAYKAVVLSMLPNAGQSRFIKYAGWKCSIMGVYRAFWVYLDNSNGLNIFLIMNCVCGRIFHGQGDLTWHLKYCKERTLETLKDKLPSVDGFKRLQGVCVCVSCVHV